MSSKQLMNMNYTDIAIPVQDRRIIYEEANKSATVKKKLKKNNQQGF